jgi:cyclic pyranopterin phosphate synthase
MEELSHINKKGEANMVDVSAKVATERRAVASALVRMKAETLAKVKENTLNKGDVLATARIAGITAAKKTPDLIPLCHPIMLGSINMEFNYKGEDTISITTTAVTVGQTGVEMEAMTAASVAALTVYDMVKAVDRGVTIEKIRWEEKSGGKSGTYKRGEKNG